MTGYSKGLLGAVISLAIVASAVVAPADGTPRAQAGDIAGVVADDANAPTPR